LQRPFAAWDRPFQNFNLTVVDVLDAWARSRISNHCEQAGHFSK
jgi:hypothetical protein